MPRSSREYWVQECGQCEYYAEDISEKMSIEEAEKIDGLLKDPYYRQSGITMNK